MNGARRNARFDMNASLKNVELTVERDMVLLRALTTPAPSRELVARVAAAVVADARRRAARRAPWRQIALGAAAVIGLVLALRGGVGRVAAGAVESDSAAFDAWVAAVDDSNRALDEATWVGADRATDGGIEFDRALDGLERSFRIGT